MNLMSKGNSKVKHTLIFNTLSGTEGTCSQNCKDCYAPKAHRYPSVVNAWTRNTILAKTDLPSLKRHLTLQIAKSKLTTIRIHESGDFFSQEYVDMWIEIAGMFPDKSFYAYTKEDYEFGPINIINSYVQLDGRKVYNYGSQEFCDRMEQEQGYFVCPARRDNDIKCNAGCNHCHANNKVVF